MTTQTDMVIHDGYRRQQAWMGFMLHFRWYSIFAQSRLLHNRLFSVRNIQQETVQIGILCYLGNKCLGCHSSTTCKYQNASNPNTVIGFASQSTSLTCN